MINDNLVIDAVVHAYMFQPDNRNPDCPPEAYAGIAQFTWSMFHEKLSKAEDGYTLSLDEFTQGWLPEEAAAVYFEESDVDIAVFHSVPFPDFFAGGATPFTFGAELKKQYPDRIMLYAPVQPVTPGDQSKALDLMEEHAAAAPIDGFKFYPSSGAIKGRSVSEENAVFFDDEKHMYPYYEKARELGVSHVAMHKGIPALPAPMVLLNPDDVTHAAESFPDITFEVVHSGWAFLDESALQLMGHPNIFANLENVTNFLVRHPRRFAEIVGKMLEMAGPDQLLFATGAVLNHPQPILDALMAFEMPQDLLEMGVPEMTDDVKAKMIGGNYLRMHGLDESEAKSKINGDGLAERRTKARDKEPEPWQLLRRRVERGEVAPAPAQLPT